jgi:hypothetical protein
VVLGHHQTFGFFAIVSPRALRVVVRAILRAYAHCTPIRSASMRRQESPCAERGPSRGIGTADAHASPIGAAQTRTRPRPRRESHRLRDVLGAWQCRPRRPRAAHDGCGDGAAPNVRRSSAGRPRRLPHAPLAAQTVICCACPQPNRALGTPGTRPVPPRGPA